MSKPGRPFLASPEPDPLEPDDPPSIGPYRLRGRLGSGGMGVVYLAADHTGHLVALKVISARYADRYRFRERFRHEIRAMRRVARPFTARVLDAEVDAEQPYLVTEYIEGPTLQQAIDETGPWKYSLAKDLAMATALALRQMHEVGVVHRDYKPGNVLLSLTGPKVIDFGIAAATDFASGAISRDDFGTLTYMAPEQLLGHEGTEKADIFAWAGTLVFASTGRPPFGTGPDRELRDCIVDGEPDLTGVDPRLHQTIRLALRKDPLARPAARDLLDELGISTGRPETEQLEVTESLRQTWDLQQAMAPPTHGATEPATASAATPLVEEVPSVPTTRRDHLIRRLRGTLWAGVPRSYWPLGPLGLLALLLLWGPLLVAVGIAAVVAAGWLTYAGHARRWLRDLRVKAPYFRALRLNQEGHHRQAENLLWDIAYEGGAQWAPHAAVTVGNLLRQRGRLTAAIHAYELATESDDPELSVIATLNLGHVYQAQHKRTEALRAYQRARTLAAADPTGETNQYTRAAATHLRQMVELSDEDQLWADRRRPPAAVPPPSLPYWPALAALVSALCWTVLVSIAAVDAYGDGLSSLLSLRPAILIVLLGGAALVLTKAARQELQHLGGFVDGGGWVHGALIVAVLGGIATVAALVEVVYW